MADKVHDFLMLIICALALLYSLWLAFSGRDVSQALQVVVWYSLTVFWYTRARFLK
jgi:hypothetical protein